MTFLEQFFGLFEQIDPIGVVITMLAGILWGYLFREYELDRRTIYLLFTFYFPFIVGRIIYGLTFTLSGAGYIGIIFLTIYALSAYLTRAWFRGYNTIE